MNSKIILLLINLSNKWNSKITTSTHKLRTLRFSLNGALRGFWFNLASPVLEFESFNQSINQSMLIVQNLGLRNECLLIAPFKHWWPQHLSIFTWVRCLTWKNNHIHMRLLTWENNSNFWGSIFLDSIIFDHFCYKMLFYKFLFVL